jgi:hypothetical protein
VKPGPLESDRDTIEVEIARLRDFDLGALHARWQAVLRIHPA